MTTAAERLLSYVRIDTAADESAGASPSSPGQRELAERIAAELREIGLTEVSISPFGVLRGVLPATPELESLPAVGFIAHLDTSPDAPGKNVNPQLHPHYDGGPVPLGDSGKTLDPARFPELAAYRGQTLITTDGTTLLGADDKAGAAEIVTMLERLTAAGTPHRKICVAFTPDEEIGRGTDHFDLAAFGAAYAYTADGGAAGSIEAANFNAALATVRFAGRPVHPGSAKGKMRNAITMAMEFHALLPASDIPERTEGTQGFYHLEKLTGTVAEAAALYLLRDHDARKLEARKAAFAAAAETVDRRCGEAAVTLAIRDQYRNMAEIIARHPEVVERAERAAIAAGLTPTHPVIRGGTDGAELSWRGLPCPNLGTGGHNFHGEYEFITVEAMEQATAMLLALATQTD